MDLVGRTPQLRALDRLLDEAVGGTGGLVVLVGPRGSGRTSLLAAVVRLAHDRGLQVLGATGVRGRPGLGLWSQLCEAAGAPEEVAGPLWGDAGGRDLVRAARALVSGPTRVVAVDDIDLAGAAALEMLAVLASMLVGRHVAVVVTAGVALGVGRELRLDPLTELDLSEVVPESRAEVRHALWAASAGSPGVALELAAGLAAHASGADPVVQLALSAPDRGEFLDVDPALVHLLEIALPRTADPGRRARLLARTSRELLGDPRAAGRRRRLADQALALAREAADPQTVAAVLDDRLHALWDPAGVSDRLIAAAEIEHLGRTSGDDRLARHGMFWHFIALMELGRVHEAEVALAAFERSAAAAGDASAMVMTEARHGMLAGLMGRFDDTVAIAERVGRQAAELGMPDAERVVGAVLGPVAFARDDRSSLEVGLVQLRLMVRHHPGHLYEASLARMLAALDRLDEAAAELDRVVPRMVTANGPRWLGAMADGALAAAAVHHLGAAAALYPALAPYRGRLVVWGGAVSVGAPVEHYLGVLGTLLGRPEAVADLEESCRVQERVGALPGLANSLVALAAAYRAQGAADDRDRAAEAERRGVGLADRLGMTVLPHTRPVAEDAWVLRRDGDLWVLQAGHERAQMPHSRGLEQLRLLLAAPRRDIAALDLAAGGAGLAVAAESPVVDGKARSAYRRRLAVLQDDLDAADVAGDVARAARAEAERQALLAELRRATGLGGRTRRTTDEAERARVNATRTLRATLRRIAEQAPRAGAHLQASVRTGLSCRYDPAPGGPTRWQV